MDESLGQAYINKEGGGKKPARQKFLYILLEIFFVGRAFVIYFSPTVYLK